MVRNDRKNAVVEIAQACALQVIQYVETLEGHRKYTLANQILRSGTSIGANVCEAQNAESLRDFIHKLKVAAKEADELSYFLALCHRAPGYPDPPGDLLQNLQSVIRLISRIISTSRKKISDQDPIL